MNGYFLMKETDVINYTKKMDYFASDAELVCNEIGDGNLNYIFRVLDKKNGKSLIIKQAGPEARISNEIKISPDRNRIESEILQYEHELAPGLVPVIYKFDPVMNCCVMEDLSDHVIMRKALMEHQRFPLFVDHITTFMCNTLLLTSDVVLGHKKKKELVKNYINPDLCEITEDLVYTEPFFDCQRNDLSDSTRQFAKSELWNDEKVLLETAKLKFEFMNNAQSLIHGDLHTGSIFVKPDSTKVIDPEFAFYGPAGYDVGNIVANLIFAYENAEATIDTGDQKTDYKNWLEKTIIDTVDMFSKKFLHLWNEKVTERVAKYKGFNQYYLGTIIHDTAAVAGCELNRRIIGMAHVKDITSIPDPQKRATAEKVCISIGKRFILERNDFANGKDFMDVVKSCEAKFI
jgi:5-methylthioribose kinase